MKILHMISGGDVGGAKTHVLSLLEGLCREDTVKLLCFTEGEFAQEARELGIPTLVFSGKNPISVSGQILELIRAEGYEILHCHGARANLMALLLRRKLSIPAISTVHSDYRLDYIGRPFANLTFGNINRIALPRFDAWVSVSDPMTQTLSVRGFDPQRIFTLHNGVDFSAEPSHCSREEYFRKIGLEATEDSVVFGIAARINPVKDMTTLVTAFAPVAKAHPSARLIIAGRGEEEDAIRALADKLCPKGSVCFAGWEKDINSFYHAIDVNLLTSISEGFPYALPEGARMKCATIASMVGGVPTLIDHGINGLLFTPKDVNKLSEYMHYLIEHPQERETMGQALYEKTKEKFSLSVMIRTQRKIYERILRRCQRQKTRDGVVICGAYGKGNKGDNAILSAIVDQLYHIDRDIPIHALSRDPAQTRGCAAVNSLYSFHLMKCRKLLKKSELYISGGGTLMQDSTSTRSLLYYLYSIRQAKRAGCKVMLYGCGIGPIHRKINRRRAAACLNRYADVICVRDHRSLEFLKELGVDKPKIHLTADPALLAQAGDINYLHACALDPKESYALFSLRPWKGYEEKNFIALVEYVYKQYQFLPILYCMEPKRDLPILHSLAKKLSCPYLILDEDSTGKQTISLIRRMSLVVSMRLHTLIFAAGQGIPMVGIAYDPKVSGFLDDLGTSHYLSLEEADKNKLMECIDKALADQAYTREQVQHLRALAKENERYAEALLNGQ